MTRLFGYRYPGDGELGGHAPRQPDHSRAQSDGGDFLAAVDQARELLGIAARVLPSTLDQVDLVARAGDRVVRGQTAIKGRGAPIRELTLVPPGAAALPAAVEAILAADLITLGPGSLFTSVIPNLLVAGIREALSASQARKMYICNAMTEVRPRPTVSRPRIMSSSCSPTRRGSSSTTRSSTPRRSRPRCASATPRSGPQRLTHLPPPPRDGAPAASSAAARLRGAFRAARPGAAERAIFEIYQSHAEGRPEGCP